MKRTISLVLCLTILLGLLTGLAGATEGTETETWTCTSDLQGKTWLFGTMDLIFEKGTPDKMEEYLPETARVYFDNDKLGTIGSYGNGRHYWNQGDAYPNQSGNLCVELDDGIVFRFAASTANAAFGVYTDSMCGSDDYLPWNNLEVEYTPDVTKTVYLHTSTGSTLLGAGFSVVDGTSANINGGEVTNSDTCELAFTKSDGVTRVQFDANVMFAGESAVRQMSNQITFSAPKPSVNVDYTLVTSMDVNDDYNGTQGFALYLEDKAGNLTLIPNNDPQYQVFFSNPHLGTLEKTDPSRAWAEEMPWTWSSWRMQPDEIGEIVVLYNGGVYTCTVSTETPNVGVFTGPSSEVCNYVDNELAPVYFSDGSDVPLYVKVNREGWVLQRVKAGLVTCDNQGNESCTMVPYEIADNCAIINCKNLFGYNKLRIEATYQTFGTSTRTNIWDVDLWGESNDPMLRMMTYGVKNMRQFNGGAFVNLCLLTDEWMETKLPETASVQIEKKGLGELISSADTNLSEEEKQRFAWVYDLWSLTPYTTGYLTATVGEQTYREFMYTTYPDIGLFTSIDCDADSYLVKNPVQSVECKPGESVTIYAHTMGADSNKPGIVRGNEDLIQFGDVILDQRAPITFTAPEDTSGEFFYEFEWDDMCLEVRFNVADTSTLRIVDSDGNRRYYDGMNIPGSTGFCLQYLNENEEWVNLYPGNGKVYLAAAGENGQLDLDNADKLGLLTEHSEHWEWNLRTADPYVKGFICAKLPDNDEVFCAKISTGKLMAPMYDEDTYLRPDNNGIIYYEYQTGDQIELHMEFDPEMAANYRNVVLSYSKNHPGIKANVDDDEGGVTITFDTTGLSGLYTMELNVDLTSPLEGNMDSHCWNVIRFVQTVAPPSRDLAEIPDYVKYSPEEHFRFAPIQVGEKTYYLAVAGVDHTPDNALINPVKGDTMGWAYGTHWTPYAVMFFENVNGVAVRIPEDKLQETFGSVEDVDLNIYAIQGREGEPGWTGAPKMMPHIYKGDSRWLASRIYNMTHDSVGDYLLVASAKVNGQMYYGYSPIHMMKMVTELQTVSSVEEANKIMAEHEPNSFMETLILSFEGVTELHGTIEIPLGLGVTLHGDSRNGTTLYGGVCSESGGYVENFKFKGAGKDQETWPENEHGVITGTKNYALYGRESMAAGWCTFIGYDTAVSIGKDAPGCHFGGSHNTYMDNRVGIYVDYYGQGGGQGSRENNKFIGNDIAIWLNHVEYMDMDFFRLRNAWFINNEVDIKNETNRLYWLPMCYFLHSNDKVDLNNPGHHSDKQSNHWQPVVKGVLNNNKKTPSVIASPAAVDPTFKNTAYYYPKHIYVYPAMRALYPIVDLEDGMKVTALSEYEEEIASVSLDAAEATTQGLSLMADGPTNLDGPSSEPPTLDAAFDSTMTREDEDGKVTLSIAAIPEGYTATVEVPCEGWTEAVVMLGDEVVEDVTVQNGIITFPAQTSEAATYTIIRDNFVSELTVQQNGTEVEDPEALPVGEFQLSGKVDVTEAVKETGTATVMVAGYTKEGKMVLSEIPVLEDGSFDLTINNTGNLHNLKVFLLNSMENFLPINGAQKIGKL